MNTIASVMSVAVLAMFGYYFACFVLSTRTNRPRKAGSARQRDTYFVIVVPAHNEELVITQTVHRLRELRWGRFIAVVMNDGSTDRTGEVARAAAANDPRVLVVDRAADIAGKGKGEVLNHAYRAIRKMSADSDPRLEGASPEEIVIGVVDADGWLERNALAEVSPYFDDRAVGGVQLPVRIWNAQEGFLALMQDIEFLAFSRLVQAARDPLGSVGLGGNGQFVRLSALLEFGNSPWTRSLTEDLDLTMRMIANGWAVRFCPRASVAQQGLTKPRPLFRQRARWIQGHYSCWKYIPSVLRARGVPLYRRLDASFYLAGVVFVLVFFGLLLISIGNYSGLWTVTGGIGWLVGDGPTYVAVTLTLTLAPMLLIAASYQASATTPVPWWALPGVFFLFNIYGYLWAVPATFRAFGRFALGRNHWVKTPRGTVTAKAVAAEAAARA
jgi:cellulose synthase/poly-beta-1,6-N-acetylglucosamine synthase-like glycosyltransferase